MTKDIVKSFLKQLKSTNWHIMFDNDGNLIKVNKPFKNDFVITEKIDFLPLVYEILKEEIDQTLIIVEDIIREETKK